MYTRMTAPEVMIRRPARGARAMRARQWSWLAAAALAACAPKAGDQPHTPLEQGRLYTSWLYGNQYQKLWERFSPEMRESFGSVADLASFAGRAITRLGPEKRALNERVEDDPAFRVYQRTAAFDTSRLPMLIEWGLAKDGAVTGLVVRPLPEDER
jgi:hypothetical protein